MSHEPVGFWWRRLGPLFSAEIRRKCERQMRTSRWRWHLDEVFATIEAMQRCLRRAVDQEGEVLEAHVSKQREKMAALRFLCKLLKRHRGLVACGLRSCVAALDDIGADPLRSSGAGRATGPRPVQLSSSIGRDILFGQSVRYDITALLQDVLGQRPLRSTGRVQGDKRDVEP
ncbi:DDE-type integrase/transposase/recombinase [Rubellimicrobium mesophilum]|uniref:DDE-type integrase/transposase/recombinase n=1 Tax=Rubellimicrobium mesophilum TaxID=1123067 RepID=UPI0006887365|nr:DDE-type integrase/transposase/recombinase [Rubellimicrobium mesophilum]